MERNLDAEAAIIANDLNSLVYRIEMLQAHPKYTDAVLLVQQAYLKMGEGRSEIHQSEMSARFAKPTLVGGPQSEATKRFSESGA